LGCFESVLRALQVRESLILIGCIAAAFDEGMLAALFIAAGFLFCMF
jgi:hypothetical protein